MQFNFFSFSSSSSSSSSSYYYYYYCFLLCFSFCSSLLLTEPSLARPIFKVKFHLNRPVTVNRPTKLTNFVDPESRFSFEENQQERTTVISWCLPSKFCISRRQTLTESLVTSSIQMRAASYSLPLLRCSDVTRTIGASANLP